MLRLRQTAMRHIAVIGMAADHAVKPSHGSAATVVSRRIGVLLAATLSVSMAYGVTLPVLPFMVERLTGWDARAVGWHTGFLTGIYTLGLLVFSAFWGVISDRLGSRPTVVIGLVGAALSLLLLDRVSSLFGLYVARGLSGALSAAVLPAVLAYTAERSRPAERPRRFAAVSSASTLGFLLGPVLGSWLSPMVLAPVAGMRFGGFIMLDSPFFSVALACVLVAAALSVLPASDGSYPDNIITMAAKSVPHVRQMHCGLLLTFVAVFAITVAEVGITLLGRQMFTLSPDGIARFFLLCSGLMIVMQLGVFPACMQRFTLPSLIALALLLAAVGLLLIPYSRSTMYMMLAFSLVSAGTAILIPALATLISEAAGPLQGKAMGQQTTAANLAQALAAALTGALFLVESPAPFAVAAAAAGGGALIAKRLNRMETA